MGVERKGSTRERLAGHLSARDGRTDRSIRALKYVKEDGSDGVLDGLLVPANVAQTCQVAAQAGVSVFKLSTHPDRRSILTTQGYPMITVPAGINSYGMPYGLAIMHTAWSESRLVRWASAIESIVNGRRRPRWAMRGAKNIPVLNEL